MPIFWAMSITLSMPTLVDMRTNAQFTDSVAAACTVMMPPSPSPPELVDDPPKPGTLHGAPPSIWSLRE